MNLYILVEGRRTEPDIYPAWLRGLLPLHQRVETPGEAETNNYFLISGEGYPHILGDWLTNAVWDLQDHAVYDYFVICLDAEGREAQEVTREVEVAVSAASRPLPNRTKLSVIVQRQCIESWLLGNRTVYQRRPQCPTLRSYIGHYDVYRNCPEAMGNHPEGSMSIGDFHYDYLKRLFAERREPGGHGCHYSKRNPGPATEISYLRTLLARAASEESHLGTFRSFISLCRAIRAYAPGYEALANQPDLDVLRECLL